MVVWALKFTKQAIVDSKKLNAVHLKDKAQNLLEIMKIDPYKIPPQFEKLTADLTGKYSRRLNIKHRIVYSIDKEKKEVIIYGMFSHYRDN